MQIHTLIKNVCVLCYCVTILVATGKCFLSQRATRMQDIRLVLLRVGRTPAQSARHLMSLSPVNVRINEGDLLSLKKEIRDFNVNFSSSSASNHSCFPPCHVCCSHLMMARWGAVLDVSPLTFP